MSDELTIPLTREAVSLENCDKEPVHTPGHIQPFAVMLAIDPELNHVTHCSENIGLIFDYTVAEVLGRSLDDIFNPELLHSLNNTLSLASSHIQRERVGEWESKGKKVEMWTHFSGDVPILELEIVSSNTLGVTKSIMIVRSLLGHLGQIETLQEYLNDAVFGLRNLSGFDRVLLYRFDQNGDGEIKAEACGPNMEPFLGLRFPKWDIPNQARAIMLKLPLRIISDTTASPVKLMALDETALPLDLTYAASRGTSPIHIQYLENMGVAGTMTLSIIVGGKLWGLFAFHHLKPRLIGADLRGAAELFVQFFSLQIEQRFENIRNKICSNILSYQSELLDASGKVLHVTDLVKGVAKPFCELLGADGLLLLSKEDVYQYGLNPDLETGRAIARGMLADIEGDIAVSTSLVEDGYAAGPCAGALAFVLDEEELHHLVFFRKEAILAVNWAGAPNKKIVDTESGPRLLPRGSFKAFAESVEGRCLPWEEMDLLAASEIRKALIKADEAMLRRLNYKEERQRSLYIAELNHRVRNILALIRSLSRRAHESAYSLETYAVALEERIAALGVAHDLAANGITSGVGIQELLEAEFKPYTSIKNGQVSISGSDYVLRSDIAPTFALIAHELVTNCVKHGALTSQKGHIDIQITSEVWDERDGVRLIWTERGGPVTRPPNRVGFGLGLIEKAIPYELDGDSHIEFNPEGFSARFWLSSTLITRVQNSLTHVRQDVTVLPPPQKSMPETVLVLEDSLMVAMDMSEMLKSIGVKDVQTYPSVSQAKRGLASARPNMAILDINLRDTLSFEFAEILDSEGIPFCFASGYSSNYTIPDAFKQKAILTKPVKIEILEDTIKAMYVRELK